MARKPASEPAIEDRRIRQRRKVSIFVGDSKTPLIGYATNLSMTGLFVELPDPPLPPTVVRLEMVVAGGFEVIRCRAQVVWKRHETAAEPSGVGLRFFKLERSATEILRRLVEEEVQRGNQDPGMELRDAVGQTLSAKPGGPPAASPPTTVGRWSTAGAVVTVGIIALVTLLLFSPTSFDRLVPFSAWLDRTSPSDLTNDSEDPRLLVDTWISAWTDQRLDELVGLYSTEFQPPEGSLADWQRNLERTVFESAEVNVGRRDIHRLSATSVSVQLELEATDASGAESFSRRTWLLVLEENSWRILEESITR